MTTTEQTLCRSSTDPSKLSCALAQAMAVAYESGLVEVGLNRRLSEERAVAGPGLEQHAQQAGAQKRRPVISDG